MANGVLMPKAGITVESCIIGKWKKAVGDHVAMGEILFDYETDKAAWAAGASWAAGAAGAAPSGRRAEQSSPLPPMAHTFTRQGTSSPS